MFADRDFVLELSWRDDGNLLKYLETDSAYSPSATYPTDAEATGTHEGFDNPFETWDMYRDGIATTGSNTLGISFMNVKDGENYYQVGDDTTVWVYED